VVKALESDADSAQRYSISTRRSLITMVARRALLRVNGSASNYFVRPFVVMAARVLGPGPTRLRLVKLAHNLSTRERPGEPVAELAFAEEHAHAAQRTQRAA
jgi:hypothetical protein